MKLSKNFSLDEFLFSQTAARNEIDMKPSKEVIRNLEKLAKTILQPLRTALGPVVITSGYRPKELNDLVGGSKYSAHLDGRAADIKVIGRSVGEVFDWIIEHKGNQVDQVIHEFDRWIHIGISDKPRNQHLYATRKDGKTKYEFVNG